MKKLISTAVSIALASSAAVVVPASSASAQGASGTVEFCKVLVENGFFDKVGKCVSNSRKSAPRLCKEFEGTPVYDLFGWRNRGDCVSFIRDLQNG